MQAYSLPPPPSSPKRMHTLHETHAALGLDKSMVFGEGRMRFIRVHHGLPFLKMILRVVVLAKHFYVQGQPTSHSVHDSLRLPNLALLLSLVQGSSEENEAYSHQIQRRGQVENK